MKRLLPNRSHVLPGWQTWVCVLLIGLVLYNPFAGLFGSNDSLSYDRLARNRATVGASELEHFSPVRNSTEQSDVSLNLPVTEMILVVQKEYPRQEQQNVFLPHSEIIHEHWNRPPPSL